MSRRKKLLLNTGTGFLKQVIVVICGFILPRYMILYYGSAVNGVVSSIANYLSFISLLDMGVGAVVQANLYKPLAEGDRDQISRIVISSERFFRRLAFIFIAYITVLCFVFPLVVNTGFNSFFTITLLIIISISTLAEYMFGITYQLLLNADQRSYVPLLMQIGTVLMNTVFAILLMKMGASIHVVKLMTSAVYVLRPVGQMLYVRKHYRLNRKIEIVGEPIQQKWNGFSQHLAAVVCRNIDIVVLSLFSTMENVSIYSVYFNVSNGIEQIVLMAATGLESFFGNMIAKRERDELCRSFQMVEWIIHTGVTVIFTIAALTIVPFVSVYTRGITDADYIQPVFGALLVAAYGFQCIRVPYFRVVKAAGHFKETQNGAYISAILNIVITVSLVFRYGLIGAAAGTLAAMLYHTCYFVWYLRKNILERSIWPFILYILVDGLTVFLSVFASRLFSFQGESYQTWVLYAAEISAVVIMISSVLNLLVYRKQAGAAWKLLRK